MAVRKTTAVQGATKSATGIGGFDELSHGGLPSRRTSLLMGGPGSGKTVFALQHLVNAVKARKETGIFVAFEESPRQIMANAAGFDWRLSTLAKDQLFFMDAHLSPEVVQSGEFDLSGLLVMLKAKLNTSDARCVVFDGVDVLLTLLRNPALEMREIYRIRDWLVLNDITGIITAKLDSGNAMSVDYGFMQFMVDCVVKLDRRLDHGVALHRIEIRKYRGSDFVAGEFPVSFGRSGMEVGAPEPMEIHHSAPLERLSAGFSGLDEMLGGGLFRSSSTLITGLPGTSKTTLAGKFAEAACLRGERTLYVSFDEGADPVQRNLASVGVNLAPHIKSGVLRMYSGRIESMGAEDHLIRLKALIREHQPRCVVIDPISALAKAGGLGVARAVASRLIYVAKEAQITLLVTAVNDTSSSETEVSDLQVSTIADTWIHLSHVIHGGERNRALTIIKSRGTWHSNQVRELVLDETGPELVAVYTAGGEVLMGTQRWEKEREERAKAERTGVDFDYRQGEMQIAEADTLIRIKALQQDLERQRKELRLHAAEHTTHLASMRDHAKHLHQIRKAQPASLIDDAGVVTKSRNGRVNGNGSSARRKNKPEVGHGR